MQIRKTKRYQKDLSDILIYISKDKITASKNFRKEIDKRIQTIPNFPYQYKQSIYSNDKNIRELTFKGYTLVYRVNKDKNLIEILTIFNRNKPKDNIIA